MPGAVSPGVRRLGGEEVDHPPVRIVGLRMSGVILLLSHVPPSLDKDIAYYYYYYYYHHHHHHHPNFSLHSFSWEIFTYPGIFHQQD
jgi:hypothetical protein